MESLFAAGLRPKPRTPQGVEIEHFELSKHQIAAVKKVLSVDACRSEGGDILRYKTANLLVHCLGAGKTLTSLCIIIAAKALYVSRQLRSPASCRP